MSLSMQATPFGTFVKSASAMDYMSPLAYLVGGGQGAFWVQSAIFFPLSNDEHWAAHNVYIQLLFDSGAIGVIAYLSVFGLTFRTLWKKVQLRFEVRMMSLTLLAAYAFMSYSDNMLDYLVVNWNFWFFIGLVAATEANSKRDPQEVTA